MKKLMKVAGVIAGVVVLGAAMATSASAQRPALTQDVDNPGRNVFMLRGDTTSGGIVSFVVPATQRYVIEQFTVDCAVPTTTYILDGELVTTIGGEIGFYHVPVHYTQNIGFGLNEYGGTGLGPIYADPGTAIDVLASVASRLTTDFRGCSFVLSGHVINNP